MGANELFGLSSDPQGTAVEPLSPALFDADRYADYCMELEEKCRRFWAAPRGVLVHRRFRVPQVFAGQCGDRELSLALQLGALRTSMDYPMDVPNFLEPWYGIGMVPAAYGADYQWHGDLAPATVPLFKTLEEALAHEPREIEETPAGRHILDMIEYFLEKTRAKISLSLSDVQSPLNAAAALVDAAEFYISCIEDPEGVRGLLDRVTALTMRFCKKQIRLIGENLALPGHGFSSCRSFTGLGCSDDNAVMLSPETYRDLCGPFMSYFGELCGGFAFHSCGDWSAKTGIIKKLTGLTMVDGAFTARTDPSPNPPAPFRSSFSGSGICVNARVAGSPGEALAAVKGLYDPGMKLIAVSYCSSPEDQYRLYHDLHALA